MFDWFASRALAYEINVPLTGTKKTYATFNEYFLDLIKLAVNIAAALAVLVIVYGAFKYATSGGDETKAKDGKDMIIGALVGFGLLLLINVLIPLLGLKG